MNTTKKLKEHIYTLLEMEITEIFTRPKHYYSSFLNPITTTSSTTMDLRPQEKPLVPSMIKYLKPSNELPEAGQ
jgi:hypothetical protein